jgi:hypothetical protein
MVPVVTTKNSPAGRRESESPRSEESEVMPPPFRSPTPARSSQLAARRC